MQNTRPCSWICIQIKYWVYPKIFSVICVKNIQIDPTYLEDKLTEF